MSQAIAALRAVTAFSSREEFDSFVLNEKVKRVALGVISTLLVPCFMGLAAAAVSLPPLLYGAALLGTGMGALFSLYHAFRNLCCYLGLQNLAPPSDPYPGINAPWDSKNCYGRPIEDSQKAHKERIEMIKRAQHNVTLSGCYCGGEAFQEVLQAIQGKLNEHQEFRALIITSEIFLTEKDRRLIEEMEQGGRFECVIHSEAAPLYTPDHGLTWTTNHTKGTIIDGGAEWIMGGSGILDAWKETDGLTPIDSSDKPPSSFPASLFDKNGFRDIDFHFYQTEEVGLGSSLFIEMHRLADRLAHRSGKEVTHFDPLSRAGNPPLQEDSLIEATLYFQGPENHPPLPYLHDLVQAVNGAKTSIEICHLYFHPPQELFDALANAAKRGVKITLVTNRDGEEAPFSHSGFADLSEWHLRNLLTSDGGENVEASTYYIPQTTLHKKVILIDGETAFVGSSNIGWKSLEGNDYEVNMKVVSKTFCQETQKILGKTKGIATKLADAASPPSLMTRIHACWQSGTSFIL